MNYARLIPVGKIPILRHYGFMTSSSPTPPHEILLEIRQVGNLIRVAAIDAASGTEVVFQAPASTAPADIRRLAAQKLAYRMQKDGSTDKR